MAYFNPDLDLGLDAEQESDFYGQDKECTIFVTNLPPELDKGGVKGLFQQFGTITDDILHFTRYAYITYASYREAEHAIRKLNGKKPLYLKVALKREEFVVEKAKDVQESHVEERSRTTNAQLFASAHNDLKHPQVVGRGQALSAFRKPLAPQKTMLDRSTENGSLLSQASNFCDAEDSTDINRLWTRGVVTVTPDGRRHVSLGRGYTQYDFPEQPPKIKLEEAIVHVHEARRDGLYEFGEDKFKTGVQNCIVCSNETTNYCEKCWKKRRTYYCSQICQEKDWPRHISECQLMPRLMTDAVNDMSSLQITKENQTNVSPIKPDKIITGKTIASNEVKLRRPISSNTIQAENSDSTVANTNIDKNMDMTNYSTDNNINNQKHLPRDDNNVPFAKAANQPALSTLNTKDFSKQNQFYRCNNTKDENNTENLRGNDRYSLTTSNSINQNYYTRNHTNGAIQKTIPDRDKFDYSKSRGRNNNDRNQSYQKNELKYDRKSTVLNDREHTNRRESISSSNSITMDDDLAFCKDMYLSKTEFIEVEIIVSLSNSEYWIFKLKDFEAREDLMGKLQKAVSASRNVQPIIGEIYGIRYGCLWHRALILSLNPLKIRHIDFGNEEVLKKDAEIKEIPADITKIPNFARKIRLSSVASEKYTNLNFGDRLLVKMLSIDAEKTITVDVKEQTRNVSLNMDNASDASMIQIPDILDAFVDLFIKKGVSELEINGYLNVNGCAQENIYSVLFVEPKFMDKITLILEDLPIECAKIRISEDYKAQGEDLICGETEDTWYRGYISSSAPDLSIKAIDEARIIKVNKIIPCPKEYLKICSLGVICKVNHPNKLKVGELYTFKGIINKQNCKQKYLEVKLLLNNEFVCEAMLESWNYTKKSSSIPAFCEVKTGAKICLVSYRNHYKVFARSLDEESIEYYNNIMQRVAQCARTAPRLSDPPNRFQAVIAPYSDNNNYRAMVLKTENDKAHIVYTDFGNSNKVNIRDLQVLPDNLKLQRSCSALLSLKDVPSDIPINEEADLFLRTLVGNETLLTCVYEGDPLKDGVYLTMPTGESVNDRINQLLVPNWKKDHDDNTCYLITDIEYASLGNVGDTVNALVHYIPEKSGGVKYNIGPCDEELYTYVATVLPKLLKEYCEKMEYYIPRKGELCLALYQGEWYRAVCIDPRKSNTTADICYIDYGNIESVEHKNLRLMPKDFIKPTAMANMCTVVNLAPVDDAGNFSPIIQKKISELIKKDDMMVKIKIIKKESGDYKIELVDIKQILIEEGLIPSS